MKTHPAKHHLQMGAMSSLTAAVLTALYGPVARAAPADDAMQEIVVTATRRAVSAQDLPISITGVTGASLDQAGIEDIAGLAHSMAGVNFTDKGPFGGVNGSHADHPRLEQRIDRRPGGLATPIVPPVATYVDDTPLFVNLRLQDLDHVEILRGPQGTLTARARSAARSVSCRTRPTRGLRRQGRGGRQQDIPHTALNEDVNGMINLPISDTFAVRLNAGCDRRCGIHQSTEPVRRSDATGAPARRRRRAIC